MPVGVQLSLDVGWEKKNQGAGGKKKEAGGGEPQLTEAVAVASTALLRKWFEKQTHIH